jgi:ZPR1 zinc finger protein
VDIKAMKLKREGKYLSWEEKLLSKSKIQMILLEISSRSSPISSEVQTDIKSETCSLHIPELHFDLQEGTLGGRFTTLEGLLQQAYEQLWGRVYNPDSDSSTPEEKDRFGKFLEKMKDAIDGKMPFTLILDDPLSASYIQNLYAPDPDPNMTIEEYERTPAQNDDLGITELIAARAA